MELILVLGVMFGSQILGVVLFNRQELLLTSRKLKQKAGETP
jgi:hypothetical protein